IQAEGIEPDIFVERLEVTRPEPSRLRVRESDLRGHLDNEKEQNELSSTAEEDISDYQLGEALNLLKAIVLSQASVMIEEEITDADEPFNPEG
ncbi:MAG: hypothetical protein HOM55_07630, partial [Proteobacteria bacterium]|nr:hypothetical protein [Pseudomonadota bacterium]